MGEEKDQGRLYPVEFSLIVQGKGLVVLCCYPDPKEAVVRAGNPIEVVRPDGSLFRTRVKELVLVMDARPGLLGLVLPDEVDKDEVPYQSQLRFLPAGQSESEKEAVR